MGIGDFFRQLTNPLVLARKTIQTQEQVYQQEKNRYPNQEPHTLLTSVLLSRMATHFKNPKNLQTQQLAYQGTFLFACLPEPSCALALGHYIFYKECPDIVEKYSLLQEEFNLIMWPVFQAKEDGTIMGLYRKQNPNLWGQYLEAKVKEGFAPMTEEDKTILGIVPLEIQEHLKTFRK